MNKHERDELMRKLTQYAVIAIAIAVAVIPFVTKVKELLVASGN